MVSRRLLSRFLLVLIAGIAWSRLTSASEPVDYTSQVKPLLREKCWACHGALAQEAKLRLDTAALGRKGGDSGPAWTPRDAAASAIVARVTHADPNLRMPQEGTALTPDQVNLLRRWIDEGALAPADETPESDPLEHWSFRPLVRPETPAGFEGADPIDAFVGRQLHAMGLDFSPPVAKGLWLRRVTFDLTGLPPTREELHAFEADDSPQAWEKVVDRLLDGPTHGERWARHWMDVWRYADWHGRRHVPDNWNSAPQVWRWRDWIIRSLNNDHGYDRMVREMLAGDELAADDPNAVVATAYLIRNWYALNPNSWMRDNVEHTAKAFLGLTINCAHCHDHKYDPIRQTDYFRFRAFFETIGVRQDRVPGEPDPGPFEEYQYLKLRKIQRLGAIQIYDKNPDAPTWFYTGGDERNRVAERGSIPPAVPAAFSAGEGKIEPVSLPVVSWFPGVRSDLRESELTDRKKQIAAAEQALASAQAASAGKEKIAAAAAQLAAAQAALVASESRIAADTLKLASTRDEAALVSAGRTAVLAERAAAVAAALTSIATQKAAQVDAEALAMDDAKRAPTLQAVATALAAAQTALQTAEANLTTPIDPMAWTPLTQTHPKTSTGRRAALARWITSDANPLAARVAVNHIWMRHFYKPLVASVFDFGRNGAKPTHPELIDWLACELRDSGWSMKKLHRRIVLSRAYRQTTAFAEDSPGAKVDPENTLLWRMNSGRLEVEAIRDGLLAISGRLDGTMFGQELENPESFTTRRRSLYYSSHPELGGKSPLGELFDGPDPTECYRRSRTVTPQQSLALTNSVFVHEQSQVAAQRIWATLSPDEQSDPNRFLVAAFETILSRQPTAEELRVCLEFATTGADPAALRTSWTRVLMNHSDYVTVR